MPLFLTAHENDDRYRFEIDVSSIETYQQFIIKIDLVDILGKKNEYLQNFIIELKAVDNVKGREISFAMYDSCKIA